MPSHHAHHPRPWHAGSTFDAGPRVPLNREQRARIKFLIEAHRRARRLTLAWRECGLVLLRRMGTSGQCDPSHETIARDTALSVRTIQRAFAALRNLGLLTWCNRLVRTGWRAEQTSNAYCWLTTALPPERLPPRKPRVPCGGQIGRETTSLQESSYCPVPPGSLEALAAVRLLMEKRNAATFAARATR